jgi:hypothetical protein
MSNAWGVSRFKKECTCHPARRHYANGLCRECYRNTPAFKAKRQEYYRANKEQWRRHGALQLERRTKQVKSYGLPARELDAMLARQGGVCAICGERPKRRGLAVDHCHRTGRVRGFLCHACNGGLGLFRDDGGLLSRAIEYLGTDSGAHSIHPAPASARDSRSPR